MLQAQPWRWYFRDRRESQPRQVGEAELRSIASAHQKERVAGCDFAEADERRVRGEVVRLHHPHPAASRQIDRTIEYARCGCGWHGRIYEIDIHALTGIETERLRGIEWRIEYRAKILADLDVHGGGGSGLRGSI